MVLSTVHGAKGREFRHVVLLDGGDWRNDSEEERRLYYVGMTRARETLTLCETASNPNPFSPRLPDAPYVVRRAPAHDLEIRPELRWRYMTLHLRDVDLGFAGRQADGSPAHAALEELATGDPLVLESVRPGAHVLGRQAVPVGRLSNSCRLPAGRIIRASVGALVWRTREQTPPEYRGTVRADGWWVLLPLVVIEPLRAEAPTVIRGERPDDVRPLTVDSGEATLRT
jgi:ATP-dependent DNA helicase RecQ